MTLKLYTVFDRVASRHLPPIVSPNDDTAKRALRGAVNGGDQNLSHHSQDYDLYCIGSFDEVTGLVIGMSPIFHVCTASSLKVVHD